VRHASEYHAKGRPDQDAVTTAMTMVVSYVLKLGCAGPPPCIEVYDTFYELEYVVCFESNLTSRYK